MKYQSLIPKIYVADVFTGLDSSFSEGRNLITVTANPKGVLQRFFYDQHYWKELPAQK